MDILHGTAHTSVCGAFHWVHTLFSSSDSINFQRLELNHKANYNRLLLEHYFVLPKCCQDMGKYCNTKETNIFLTSHSADGQLGQQMYCHVTAKISLMDR